MRFSNVILVVSGVLISAVAFGQGADEARMSSMGLVAIGSALAMGLCAIGATLAQGKAASAALEGIARNPGSREQVFVPLLLSLAFIEFAALLGFLIAFLWAGKIP
jgi:F-type H+-transporting ATPase subunit c